MHYDIHIHNFIHPCSYLTFLKLPHYYELNYNTIMHYDASYKFSLNSLMFPTSFHMFNHNALWFIKKIISVIPLIQEYIQYLFITWIIMHYDSTSSRTLFSNDFFVHYLNYDCFIKMHYDPLNHLRLLDIVAKVDSSVWFTIKLNYFIVTRRESSYQFVNHWLRNFS